MTHKSFPGRRCDNRAFTLIELLVVVSIIAVLVSILLPALGKARQQAQAAVCSSNLRNMSIAIRYYADDNRNLIPPGFGYDGMTGSRWDAGNYWATAIAPYLTDETNTSGKVLDDTVFQCPGNKLHIRYDTHSSDYRVLVYAMPVKLSTRDYTVWGSGDGGSNWRKLDSVKHAALTVAMLDYWAWAVLTGYGVPNEYDYIIEILGYDSPEPGGTVRPLIHSRGDNFAFLDGHVQWFFEGGEIGQGYVTNY